MKMTTSSILCALLFNTYTQTRLAPVCHEKTVVFYNNNHHTMTQTISSSDGISGTVSTKYKPMKNDACMPDLGALPSHSTTYVNNNDHNMEQQSTLANNNTKKPFQQASLMSLLPMSSPWLLQRALSPLKIAATALISCYGALMCVLLYESYSIQNTLGWSAWKEEIPLDILEKLEDKVAQELLSAIKMKYAQAPLTASFLSPLVYFVNDVDKELTILNRFTSLNALIAKLHMSAIFPLQKDIIPLTVTKIARLEFLKKIMVQALGNYKVDAYA